MDFGSHVHDGFLCRDISWQDQQMTEKLEQAAREVIRQHSMECLSDKTITALREALEQPVSQEPVKREHITDGSPCWCNPELNYKDPETGAEVWVHKEPQ